MGAVGLTDAEASVEIVEIDRVTDTVVSEFLQGASAGYDDAL